MKNFSFKRYGAHLRCTLKQNAGMFAVFAFLNVLFFLFFNAFMFICFSRLVALKGKFFSEDFTAFFFQFIAVAFVLNLFSCIVFIIKNFKFLYSKQKVDFFLSSPVTRGESFLSCITATAFFYAVMLSIQLIGAVIISSKYPCDFSLFLPNFVLAFVSGLLFIAVAALCAVSEGSVVTFLFSLFCVYVLPYFSVSSFLELLPEVFERYAENEYLNSILSLNVYIAADMNVEVNIGAVFVTVLSRLVLICAVVCLGLYVYNQRKSERSADMRLSPITCFFAITDIFCFLMFINKFVDNEEFLPSHDGSVYYYDFKPITLTSSLWYSLAAALIVTIVALILLRKNNAGKKQIAFTSSAFGVVLLLAVLSVSLQNGAKKFDKYVPQVSEVESVTITRSLSDNMGRERGTYKAHFSDAEMINKIVSYHRIDVEEDHSDLYSPMSVEYRLKNGKKIKRILGGAPSIHHGRALYDEIIENPKLSFFERNRSKRIVGAWVIRDNDREPFIFFKADDAHKLFSLLESDDANTFWEYGNNDYTYSIILAFAEREVPDEVINSLNLKDYSNINSEGFYLKSETFEINPNHEKSTEFIEKSAGVDYFGVPIDF